MKIAFYINTLQRGGAERVITNLANSFSKQPNCEVIMYTSYQAEDEYSLEDCIQRINLDDVNMRKKGIIYRNYHRISTLRNMLRKDKPDVLISFLREPAIRSVIAGLGINTKIITSVRNVPDKEYPGIRGKFEKTFLLPLSNGCVFQTELAKKEFPKRLQEKSEIIMNDVDESFFRITRQPQKNIVSVGRLCSQKNHPLLIRAFKHISQKHPEYKLLIYGDGPDRNQLQDLINEYHMSNRIILKGNTAEVATALKFADIFVLSSNYEGLPNALLEALAAGTPSIATDCPCGGPRMIIDHGVNGLLVPVGDEEKLADCIDMLISDSKYREDLSRNAKTISRNYIPESIFEKWRVYIERIVNR